MTLKSRSPVAPADSGTLDRAPSADKVGALPGFVLVPAPSAGTQAPLPAIGARILGPYARVTVPAPLMAPEEAEVGRLIGYFSVFGLVGKDGAPSREGVLKMLFEGLGEIALGHDRAIGVLGHGICAQGRFDEGTGRALTFQLPYESVASVQLDMRKKLFGGTKPDTVNLMGFDPLFSMRVMVRAERGAATDQPLPRGPEQLFPTLVAALTGHRLRQPGLDNAARERLTALQHGRFIHEDDSLVAELDAE